MSENLTPEEAASIGREVRLHHNLLTAAFAAELIGDKHYPFTKKMADVIFEGLTDENLGYAFAKWIDARWDTT